MVSMIVVGSVIILLLLVILFATSSQKRMMTVSVRDFRLNVEIAKTSQKRQKGLCCRESLPANQGMLFVYSKPGNQRFWMKDTKIPLDMFWLNEDKKVVHIERSVQPSSYPKLFGTEIPSQYVLETNAGFAQKHNIHVGDTASFKL